jgi:thioredoxin reductase (NADPH)
VNNNLQTSVDRIFACGDAVENAEHQLVIAAGSGAKAAIEISKSLHQ